MKNKIITCLIVALVFYVQIATLVFWAKNPSLSRMEVFTKIPRAVTLEFNYMQDK